MLQRATLTANFSIVHKIVRSWLVMNLTMKIGV